jgi:hypothetical protein
MKDDRRGNQLGPSWLLLLSIAACSGDSMAPEEPILRGQWGSDQAELIAIAAGAELRFGCAAAVIDDPITLTAANTFVAAARLSGSMASYGPDPVVRLSGSLAGSQLIISVPSVPAVHFDGGTYVLEAGVALPALEEPMCPL